MKASSPAVTGNIENKYDTANPVYRFLTDRFVTAYHRLLSALPAKNVRRIADIGCAEGSLLCYLIESFPKASVTACDISEAELAKAKRRCAGRHIRFLVDDAMHLTSFKTASYDLVTCCEVLEHLSDPVAGLRELRRISSGYILVSVPVEPLWRILNVARGRYWSSLGNTPGHLNHWTVTAFKRLLLQEGFSIKKAIRPLPWQMYVMS